MKNRIIPLILIAPFLTMCNTTFLNHKDYKFKVKDFDWNIKIEGVNGEIYVKDSNFIFGRNYYSSYLVISSENGAILDTLKPYTVENETEYHHLNNIPVDKQKYSEVTLKSIERQYRGDTETYYLIVKTLSNKEFTILFNRRQFSSIEDIIYLKDGKYVMKYNCEAGATTHDPFTTHIGLFDLEKIIKK